jgi:crotonobetainyl-CoA:carnitine CoA-transferase CaiB-like acyl-CoA transferase
VGIVPQLADERFATDQKRRMNGDALSARLAEVMRSRSAEDWIQLLEENDVPFDLCLKPGEAAQLAHLRERQALQRGFAKFPVWANGRRGGEIRSGVPRLGEHSREILVELGFNDAEIAAMVKDGLLVLG